MENTEVRSSNFTIVPNDNKKLYDKNSAFNILHVYIVERVRSFEKKGKTCYITNEQLAEATGSSEKTISRAVKLLVDERVLWAGYHYQTENDKITRQRVLRIFDESLAEYHEKKSAAKKEMDKTSESNNCGKDDEPEQGQNVHLTQTNCPPQIDKMASSDRQNDLLVYKENITEYNYKKGEELNSSPMDSHNAHPEFELITSNLFGGAYDGVSKNKRRSLEEIENEVLADVSEEIDDPLFNPSQHPNIAAKISCGY